MAPDFSHPAQVLLPPNRQTSRKSQHLSRCASPLAANSALGSPNKLTRGSRAIVVFTTPRGAASRVARAFHFRPLHNFSRQVSQAHHAHQAAFTGREYFFIVTLGLVQRAS
jgi:hypothetical protein